MKAEDCETLRGRMMDVLYDEAGAATRAEVEMHLRGCDPCREAMDAFRRVRGRLRDVGEEVVAARPARVIVLGRPPAPRWLAAARWAAAAALAAVAVLGLLQARIEAGPDAFTLAFGRGSTEAAAEQIRQEIDAALATARAEGIAERSALLAAIREELARRDETGVRAQNASLRRFATDWEELRRQEIGFVLSQIGSLEERTEQEMARTQQLLQYAVLSGAPMLEDR